MFLNDTDLAAWEKYTDTYLAPNGKWYERPEEEEPEEELIQPKQRKGK